MSMFLKVNNKHVIKSGTDFRYMCQLTLTFESGKKPKVTTEQITIDKSIAEDTDVKDIVDHYEGTDEYTSAKRRNYDHILFW